MDGPAATWAAPEAFMVASRITLFAALALLAISPEDTGRMSPAATPARPGIAWSHRPVRHDPEEGALVHAISFGSHRHGLFIERA